MQRVRPYGERRIKLGPGVVWYYNPDLSTGLCFPIVKLGYRVRLSGPAGAVETFLTYNNPTTQPQRAFFLFPLDRNVAPVKIRGKVGERQIEVEVGPGLSADDDSEKQLSLPLELCKLFRNETENVLAVPLGEVGPGGEVSFQILSAHMVYETGESGAGFSFRLPLLTSTALSTLKDSDADQMELAKGLERGAQVAASLQVEAADLEPGPVVTSQACGVARNSNGDLVVEYDRRKPLEPRDFVVDYELWTGNRPKAWMRSQGRHFLLNFLPPANPPPSHPRRLVVLVDGSEEMSRVGVKRCIDCLSFILKNLAAEDKFALVTFNREVSGYKNGDFVEANSADEALAWMQQFQFEGGADLKELLRRVVTLPRQSDSVLSVLLVTAGRIGNEPELYRLLQGSRDILRLFPILLGANADPHFARASARLTGGYAFRALTTESVSRVAERVLEHTRQPVLEGVGLQDKGLQYQGESLTPKYPTGLNWRRPITVMGAHSGQGGLEAGGTGPGGAAWSEYLEMKPSFHKVLANVWAHVKSSELDDEAQMLDKAERRILQKVIRNLSREFRLLNRYTAPRVRTSDGQDHYAPPIEASRWYKDIERSINRGKAASELLQEQKSQTGIEGGISNAQRNPGRGLKMKEVLGSKSTTAIFGSKLGHRNKLSSGVKEGLFSKPMLKSRKDSLGSPPVGQRPKKRYVPSPTPPPKAPPVSPFAQPEPELTPPQPLTTDPAPIISTKRPPVVDLGEGPKLSAGDRETKKLKLPDLPTSSEGSEAPRSSGPQIVRQNPTSFRPPVIKPTAEPIRPEAIAPQAVEERRLPTPRELAGKVSPAARQGKPEEVARNALRGKPKLRQSLMSEMRLLHGTLGETDDRERISLLTEAVLMRLAEVAPESELLVRAYGLGFQARELIERDLTEAKNKLKFWLTRFAKLF